MRIGIDVGGTKIEGIALDAAGRELRRAARLPRRATITGARSTRSPRSSRRSNATTGQQRLRRHRHSGRALAGNRSLVKNANSTWLNGRPLGSRTSSEALGRAGAARQRRQLFRAVGGDRWRRRRRRRRFRCHPRHWLRRRHRRRPARARPGPTAWPASGGTTRCRAPSDEEWPGPPVLLRADRVHRDVPVRSRLSRRLRASRAAMRVDADRDRRRHADERRPGGAGVRSSATKTVSPAR